MVLRTLISMLFCISVFLLVVDPFISLLILGQLVSCKTKNSSSHCTAQRSILYVELSAYVVHLLVFECFLCVCVVIPSMLNCIDFDVTAFMDWANEFELIIA